MARSLFPSRLVAGLALAIPLAALPVRPCPAAPAVTAARVGDGAVAAWGLVELEVRPDRSHDRPFDPDQVRVEATAQAPDGRTLRLVGFWFQDFAGQDDGTTQRLEAVGEPGWRVRLRPDAAGAWTVTATVTDATGTGTALPVVVDVGPAAAGAKGFVRQAADPRRLVRDTGQKYQPFGLNVCWSGPLGTRDFERWFDAMAATGLDWTRVWMTHFNGTALEWTAGTDGGAACGLGCWDLAAAWRLDRVLALAEERGIALQLVLQQHSQFETSNWSSWAENPWNVANGGPLTASAQLFTLPLAADLVDRRHAYTVARFAHSPALLAWELFNEVSLIEGYDRPAAAAWMRARADAIRAEDPYRHLVTNSYGTAGTDPAQEDWGYEGYGLVQLHSYLPFYLEMLDAAADPLRSFGKPVLPGEVGIDFLGQANLKDTVGAHLHNATLFAALRGFAGGAMSWWWDNYIEPNDLWEALAAPGRALRQLGYDEATGWLGELSPPADGLRAWAARVPGGALAWVHEDASDWTAEAGWVPPTRQGVVVAIPGVNAADGGACGGPVTACDTWTGICGDAGAATGDASGATVALPAFTRDVLVRVDCGPGAPVAEPAGDAAAPDLAAPDVAAPDPLVPDPATPDAAMPDEVPAPERRGGGCSARF